MRNFETSIPVGFFTYPISQAADITAFKATTVPVGEDQMPMIEQTKEIVHKFNSVYGDTLIDPKILLPENQACLRLPGIDGKAKMSKSLGNCIYLSEEPEEIKKKVFSMFTDPTHIRVEDPGKLEGNTVFTYLDAFCRPEYFAEFLPEYSDLDELKAHYQRGGLGDMKVKRFLNNVLQAELEPIRNRRKEFSKDIPAVYEMLNYIWAGMILLGVIYGVCTGQMSALTGGALDSAREAVSLCITMAGVMALWMGLMEIAQESGMIAKMTKGIRPFLKFMFPRLPEDHPAGEYITTNLIANVLGLGWACTPAGLKAMEQLAELEKQRAGQGTEKGRQGSEDRRYGAEATAASNEMCTFLILNISSLQLIPVNMIAYRSQYGSANPAVIIAPALVATLFSTIIAIIYCKWKDR